MGLLQPQESVVIFDNRGLFWKAACFVSWGRPKDSASLNRKEHGKLGFITISLVKFTTTDLWQGHLEKVNLKT